MASGREHDAMTITINSNISNGISILADFSIPFLTPRVTTTCVMVMNATAQSAGNTAEEDRFLK